MGAQTQAEIKRAHATYQLEGTLLEACSCGVLCPCWIGEDPDGGECFSFEAYRVERGQIAGVDVSGFNYAHVSHIPGNVLEPHSWRSVRFLDASAWKTRRRRKETPDMYFRQLLHDEHSCTSYVIGCVSQGAAAIVDPQGDVESYLELTSRAGTPITHIIDTHIHADHYSIAAELARRAGVPVYLGERAEVEFPYEALHNGDGLAIGKRRIRVLHTPGHTPEHVSLLVDDWFVLTGDTLFVGDVGRVDLTLAPADGTELELRARELHGSLQALLELPDHVEIYPGHYAGSVCGRGMDGKPSSTIGRERRMNDALALDVDSFVGFQLGNVPPLPRDFHRIKEANRTAASDKVRS